MRHEIVSGKMISDQIKIVTSPFLNPSDIYCVTGWQFHKERPFYVVHPDYIEGALIPRWYNRVRLWGVSIAAMFPNLCDPELTFCVPGWHWTWPHTSWDGICMLHYACPPKRIPLPLLALFFGMIVLLYWMAR